MLHDINVALRSAPLVFETLDTAAEVAFGKYTELADVPKELFDLASLIIDFCKAEAASLKDWGDFAWTELKYFVNTVSRLGELVKSALMILATVEDPSQIVRHNANLSDEDIATILDFANEIKIRFCVWKYNGTTVVMIDSHGRNISRDSRFKIGDREFKYIDTCSLESSLGSAIIGLDLVTSQEELVIDDNPDKDYEYDVSQYIQDA